jgi:hypothetical protein
MTASQSSARLHGRWPAERTDRQSMSAVPTQWIIAQEVSGHRLMYVRLLVDEALARGYQPTVVLPSGATDSEEFRMQLSQRHSRIRVIELERFAAHTVMPLLPPRPELPTLFPDGDAWLREFACRRGNWPGGALVLVMRPTGQAQSNLVRWAQSVAKLILRCLVRSRRGYKVLALRSFAAKQRRWTVADPVRVGGSARMAETLRAGWETAQTHPPAYWVGVVGALNSRKNIELVAKSLAQIERGKVGLVVAGRCHEGEATMERWLKPAREAGIPVVRTAGLLSDSQLDSILLALDCAILAHSNEGPSGILGKSKVLGTRVLLAGAQSLRRDAQFLADGTLWVRLTVHDLASGIEATLAREAPPPRSGGSTAFAAAFFD